jgi:ketosteroid isomerase-like protein
MGKLSFTDLEVFLLSRKEALVRARWRLEMKTDAPGGLFTLWLRKMAGGWKIVHDHTSAAEKKE